MLVNNMKNIFLINPKIIYITLTIKYLWMFNMSDLSTASKLIKKSSSPKSTSLDSVAENPLDMLPRQDWVQKLMLPLFALNLKIYFPLTNK